MKRSFKFKSLLTLTAALTLSASAAEKPNILFLFADDYAYDCVGATGNKEISTPNLDGLVSRGTVFSHAYNMGAWHGAVCVASRTMLNTGRFVWFANQVEKTLNQDFVGKNRMWAQLMAQAGYETYMSGKWHVKASPENSFKHTRNVRPGMPNQTKEGYNRPQNGKADKWDPSDPKFGGYWKGGKHWSEVVADDAEDFLKMAADDDKPFFMYIAFNAPHDPRQAPREFVERYPQERISLPEPFLAEYPDKDAMGCSAGLRDEKLAPFPRTPNAVKVNRREYYAIITHLDAQIGRILKALDKSGMADNTWVFFTADHGLSCGHHGLMGKQSMYDHSVRVPFFVVGPKVSGGKRIVTPIYLQDIMPTALQLAGAEVPEHVQFKSLLPLMKGETGDHYPAIYGAYTQQQRMISQDGYKLILYPKIARAKLFDLSADPQEVNDLMGPGAAPAKAKELFAEFLKLQVETGDPLELKSIYPHLM